tara:strand:- start:4079 stop:5056 length:978 start_codon:yes stop_codon:yes gene_type:complete
MSEFTKKDNPKYVDLLEEDMPISGQKFVCLSFVSPEKIIKDKEVFIFDEFLKQYDFTKSLEKFTQFLNFLSYKYKLDFEKVTKDLKEFVDEEKDNLHNISLYDEFKTFKDTKEEELEEKFSEKNNFQTSVRGLKVRGSFPSQVEAEIKCKMLREIDPNHDVFVGPVGSWMPWDPEAYKTGRVEYIEEELNQLMNEKDKNEKEAKQQFESRVRESKRKAIEENIEKAKSSGNLLSQNVDEHGNLVNIKDTNTIEKSLLENNDEITSEEIRKELFEGDNIVTDLKGDKGLSQLLNNKKLSEETNKESNLESNLESNQENDEKPEDQS